MKKGDLCEISLLGTKKLVRFLGKGKYSRAYADEDMPNKVYLRTHPKDLSKKLLVDCFNAKSPHIPRVEYLGTEDNKRSNCEFNWYQTEYSKSIEASCGEAWKQFKSLQKINEEAKNEAGEEAQRDQRVLWANKSFLNFSNRIQEMPREEISDSLKEAIELLVSTTICLCNNYVFEFRQPNLGVSADGTLQLRDVVFCDDD